MTEHKLIRTKFKRHKDHVQNYFMKHLLKMSEMSEQVCAGTVHMH